jgi:MoaA/NifB/PqqE/SkfB family radical SAM enzyme
MKKVAVIMPQPECNMVCEFCVTEDKMGTMTLEQGIVLLQEMKKAGVEIIVLGGGEPFLWKPGILNLAKAAKDLGFFVQVGTNGILLPEEFEKVDVVDRWVIPLESATASAHNRMRRYKNHHHQTILSVLEKLKSAKKSVTISTVVTTWNQSEFLDLAEFLREYHSGTNHIHAWHLYQFVPEGRGGSTLRAQDLQLPQEEYQRIFSLLKAKNLPFKIFKRSSMYHSKDVQFYYFEAGRIFSKSEA